MGKSLTFPFQGSPPLKVQPLPTTSLWHFRRRPSDQALWVSDASMSADLTDQLWEQQRHLRHSSKKSLALLRGLPALFSPTPTKA